MSDAQRIALFAGALVVAVAAFLILQPSDETEEPIRETSAPATETSPKADGQATKTAEQPPKPKPKVTRIRVRGGEPVGGPAKVAVKSGDTIRLAVTSDVADEVHVHGYDRSKLVGPGQTVRMRFQATLEGIFDVELEEHAVPIAELEVSP